MTFMWEFYHDFCKATISHFWYAVFKKKMNIMFFLFFHMLYWMIFNLLIISLVWKKIHSSSCFQNWFMSNSAVCQFYHVKLLIFQLCFSSSTFFWCKICFLSVWSEHHSCTSFWIILFVIFLNHFYCSFDCCSHSYSLLDCLLNCLLDCLQTDSLVTCFVLDSLCECLVCICWFHIISIVLCMSI